MNGTTEYSAPERLFHGHMPLVMGTKLDLISVGVGQDSMESVWKRLCSEASEMDALLNRFVDDSEVGRLNKASNIRNQSVSDSLMQVLKLSLEYRDRTSGLFDVACGRLSEIQVEEDGRVSLFGNQLDFGGFAKGYFLRRCKEILAEHGVEDAFVDFGNSGILGIGRHPCGDCWKVGVVNPYTHAVISEVALYGQALSISGNSPAYSGHIVNPITGERMEGRKLVAVKAADALDAEVLSTALMIASEDSRDGILENFPGAEYKIFNL